MIFIGFIVFWKAKVPTTIQKSLKHLFYIFFLWVVSAACINDNYVVIDGQIDNPDSIKMELEQHLPIQHQERKTNTNIITNAEGRFSLSVPADSQQVYFLKFQSQKYPLVVQPDKNLSIKIHQKNFPDSVQVDGYPEPWDEHFSDYWKQEQLITKRISKQLSEFKEGESTDIIELYKHRYKMAKRHLGNTPLELYYYRNIGDYLVKKLQHMVYNCDQSKTDSEHKRNQIIETAKKLNFFSLESLYAQENGITDFAAAYKQTFSTDDAVDTSKDDANFSQQGLLDHFDNQKARVYAEMNLLANHIREQSPESTEENYLQFLEDYEDNYPKLASYLKTVYSENL